MPCPRNSVEAALPATGTWGAGQPAFIRLPCLEIGGPFGSDKLIRVAGLGTGAWHGPASKTDSQVHDGVIHQ